MLITVYTVAIDKHKFGLILRLYTYNQLILWTFNLRQQRPICLFCLCRCGDDDDKLYGKMRSSSITGVVMATQTDDDCAVPLDEKPTTSRSPRYFNEVLDDRTPTPHQSGVVINDLIDLTPIAVASTSTTAADNTSRPSSKTSNKKNKVGISDEQPAEVHPTAAAALPPVKLLSTSKSTLSTDYLSSVLPDISGTSVGPG